MKNSNGKFQMKMTHKIATLSLILIGTCTWVASAQALELDWGGQFRSELSYIQNFTFENTDAAAATAGGYANPNSGVSNTNFQTLFLKLKPRVIVNDNISVKSEWWLGDPVYSVFGNGLPYTTDQRQYYSNQSRGTTLAAQRLWAELVTDFGTVHIGRAPLQWGLGLVWNSGDGLWDRYESTGDLMRLITKFGAFNFSTSLITYSKGNVIGTSGTGTTEFSLALNYGNIHEEDFEGGVNFIRRIGGAAQDPAAGYLGIGPAAGLNVSKAMNYNIWDISARKKLGSLVLAGEVPITDGRLDDRIFTTFAFAGEADWRMNDNWSFKGRVGYAPGQMNFVPGTAEKATGFVFNPNYRLGLIMFNYQLANLTNNPGGVNTLNNPANGPSQLMSPYDNPITNAAYLQVGGKYHTSKWTFHGELTYARANSVADGVAGNQFYNSWQRRMVTTPAGVSAQGNNLGMEIDAGSILQWDESFQVAADLGVFFPGDFYRYSNVATLNSSPVVWATVFKVGVGF